MLYTKQGACKAASFSLFLSSVDFSFLGYQVLSKATMLPIVFVLLRMVYWAEEWRPTMRMHFILAPVLLAAVPAFALQISDGQYAKTYNDHNMDTAQTKYNGIKAKMSSGVPVGTIIPWPTSGFPDGGSDSWLECNGQAVDPVIYPELYAIMHTVPDMRGRFLRAADNGKGIDSGRQVGTYQEENVGKYNVTGMYSKTATITTSTGEHDTTSSQTFSFLTNTAAGGAAVNLEGGNPAGGDTHPANFAVRYLIRAQ